MIMETKYSSPIIMHQDHSDEEDEETLSLCDLPIYGESPLSKNENGGLLSRNYSKGDHHTSSSLDGQTDHFEFFSEEWRSPISSEADNILFCGKLLVNKGHKQSVVSDNQQKLMKTTSQQRTQENRSVLQWNFGSRTSKPHDQKGKCMNKTNGSSLISAPSFNSISVSNGINNHKNNILAHRITILKSPTRSRWFVFLFGSTRIPTDMEIRETRQRQNKKIMSQQSHAASGKITSRKSRGIGWWKLIRILGCNNHHRADAVIKSSYSCAPLIRE